MPNILTCVCVSLITKMKTQEESPRLRSYSIRHLRTILVDRLLKGRGMGETPPNLTPWAVEVCKLLSACACVCVSTKQWGFVSDMPSAAPTWEVVWVSVRNSTHSCRFISSKCRFPPPFRWARCVNTLTSWKSHRYIHSLPNPKPGPPVISIYIYGGVGVLCTGYRCGISYI